MAKKNVRTKGFKPVGNPELAAAMRELRRSSAAQRHTLKSYKGTRQSRKIQAIRHYS